MYMLAILPFEHFRLLFEKIEYFSIFKTALYLALLSLSQVSLAISLLGILHFNNIKSFKHLQCSRISDGVPYVSS